jgi:signal recognition particle subunit SRP19
MRKQQKVMIWPAYFDQARTRNQGRRVPKSLAVSSPKILEIQEAAQKTGVEFEVVLDKGYSKTPWLETGLLLVEKKDSKEQVINRIAKQLLKVRNEKPKQRK